MAFVNAYILYLHVCVVVLCSVYILSACYDSKLYTYTIHRILFFFTHIWYASEVYGLTEINMSKKLLFNVRKARHLNVYLVFLVSSGMNWTDIRVRIMQEHRIGAKKFDRKQLQFSWYGIEGISHSKNLMHRPLFVNKRSFRHNGLTSARAYITNTHKFMCCVSKRE